jgi:quinol monooxygenase YgiN
MPSNCAMVSSTIRFGILMGRTVSWRSLRRAVTAASSAPSFSILRVIRFLRSRPRNAKGPGRLPGRQSAYHDPRGRSPGHRVDRQPATQSPEAGAVSELQGIARFKFHEGKLEEFKRLSAQAMEIVRTKDTGTLQYEIYFNDDQSEAIVLERYRDSEALIEHTANFRDLGPAILATGSVSGELLGEPSAELRATWPAPWSVSSRPTSRCRHSLGLGEAAPLRGISRYLLGARLDSGATGRLLSDLYGADCPRATLARATASWLRRRFSRARFWQWNWTGDLRWTTCGIGHIREVRPAASRESERGGGAIIRLADGWKKTCFYSQGSPVVPLVRGVGDSSGLDTPIGPGFTMRLYLLDHSGVTLAIELGDNSGGKHVDAYSAIVDQLQFGS